MYQMNIRCGILALETVSDSGELLQMLCLTISVSSGSRSIYFERDPVVGRTYRPVTTSITSVGVGMLMYLPR